MKACKICRADHDTVDSSINGRTAHCLSGRGEVTQASDGESDNERVFRDTNRYDVDDNIPKIDSSAYK